MKQRLEAVSWPRRLLIILGLIFIGVILASYSMYENKQKQIDALQKQIRVIKQVDNPKAKATAIPYIKRPRSRARLRLQEPANISIPSLKGIIDPNK